MMDECVGHMTEKVVIPRRLTRSMIIPRVRSPTKRPPEEFLPYADQRQISVPEFVHEPEMAIASTPPV